MFEFQQHLTSVAGAFDSDVKDTLVDAVWSLLLLPVHSVGLKVVLEYVAKIPAFLPVISGLFHGG